MLDLLFIPLLDATTPLFFYNINQELDVVSKVINQVLLCLAGVYSIVCKHARPMIYTAKAAVPEARKTFFGNRRKDIGVPWGDERRLPYIWREHFEIYCPVWSSGSTFHWRGLILKTISRLLGPVHELYEIWNIDFDKRVWIKGQPVYASRRNSTWVCRNVPDWFCGAHQNKTCSHLWKDY